MAAPIRILLVEDNAVFREALELAFSQTDEVQVVASVDNGNEAVAACVAHEPDVVLMDYRLPGLDGVQATSAVRETAPGVAVVCLTGEANAREVEALYEAGAADCVTKDQALETIVDAIRRAAGRG